jgi:hypothetical protein
MGALKKFTNRLGIFGELLKFLWQKKLWWMIPMIIILMLFVVLLILGATSGIGPFIYSVF